MKQIPPGLYKIAGITVLLVVLWTLMSIFTGESFLKPNNIENLMRRTALYGILGIGVAFVIITAGIDLSIGSVVCFSACLLVILLKVRNVPHNEYPVVSAAVSGEAVVAGKADFAEGSVVYFDRGLKAEKMIARVRSVAEEGIDQTRVVLDRGFSREDQAGYLTQLAPIVRVGKESIGISGGCQLKSGDEMWLIHPEKGLLKRKVAACTAVEGGFDMRLAENVQVDESWYALLQLRSSLLSLPVAFATVIGSGILLGLIHGLLITRLRLQPFVVTLCSLLIFRSFSRWLASDQMVGLGNDYPELNEFALGKWSFGSGGEGGFGVPWAFFVMLLVMIAAMILLNMTIWGRYMMAIGRNEEAARYSGVKTDRNKILAYVICSGLAAFGGILFLLDNSSIAPYSFGNFFELWAIAAAVLGGCSLRGGEGGILGVIVGTALMQTLYNLIVLWKIPSQLELAIVGVVILTAVIADEAIKYFTGRRRAR
jgi:ribose transport system permease protein